MTNVLRVLNFTGIENFHFVTDMWSVDISFTFIDEKEIETVSDI